MKLICPLSGITYKTSVGYGHGKVKHPIFSLPIEALLGQNLDAFLSNKLTQSEIHLFGCALLDKLPVKWECSLMESVCLPFWKQHIEKLAAVVARHDPTKTSMLPGYKIADYNCDLRTLSNYLDATDSAIMEYRYQDNSPDYLKNQTEELILKLLRRATAKATSKNKGLPSLMADWARDAVKFPNTTICLRNGAPYTVSMHWHSIVYKAFAASHPVHILSEDITLGDISELVDYCEENLDVGSLHSLALIKKLREVKIVLHEFKNDIKEKQDSAELLRNITSDTIKSPIPIKEYKEGEPRRADYPNASTFIKARLAWIKSKKPQSGETN